MKKRGAIAGFIFTFMVLAVSSHVFAAANKGSDFSVIDTDKDNVVTVVEIKAYYNNLFGQIDQNKDGVIAPDELVMKVTSFYKDADKNNDGIVTEEEYLWYKANKPAVIQDDKKESAKQRIESLEVFSASKMDIDGNGVVTEEEYIAFFGALYDGMDSNMDKQVSQNEVSSKIKERFNNIDTNKDGQISRDEYIIYWVGIE